MFKTDRQAWGWVLHTQSTIIVDLVRRPILFTNLFAPPRTNSLTNKFVAISLIGVWTHEILHESPAIRPEKLSKKTPTFMWSEQTIFELLQYRYEIHLKLKNAQYQNIVLKEVFRIFDTLKERYPDLRNDLVATNFLLNFLVCFLLPASRIIWFICKII